MARRERRPPDPSRSPLADLERELRAIDRKRFEANLGASGAEVRRFERRPRVAPGEWTQLERAA